LRLNMNLDVPEGAILRHVSAADNNEI
jgi:hypothetical protein